MQFFKVKTFFFLKPGVRNKIIATMQVLSSVYFGPCNMAGRVGHGHWEGNRREETPFARSVTEQARAPSLPAQLLFNSRSCSDGKSCLSVMVPVALSINGVCETGPLGQGI